MLDMDLLAQVAKDAAHKASKAEARLAEDLEQELWVHVLENPKRYEAYLSNDSEMAHRERQAKLFTSLVRVGKTLLWEESEHAHKVQTCPDPSWARIENGRNPMESTFTTLTDAQVDATLPYLTVEDNDIPANLVEATSIVRNVVYTLTPEQRPVFLLKAKGLSNKEIMHELGITKSALMARSARAKERVYGRCHVPRIVSGSRY